MVDGRFLIELKSSYVYNLSKEKTELKLKAAEKYALANGLEFLYWQFNDPNMTAKKFADDPRVKNFLRVKND